LISNALYLTYQSNYILSASKEYKNTSMPFNYKKKFGNVSKGGNRRRE